MTTPLATRGATTFTTPTDCDVVATRVFDAPRTLVFDAHTDPRHVPHWMLGEEGWTMPVCEIDLRPGGRWRFVWRRPNGEEMELSGVYREIVRPERLVHTEAWGESWAESVTTLVLTEEAGRTTLVQTATYPSREDRDRALSTGMIDGWGAGLEKLAAYLPTQ